MFFDRWLPAQKRPHWGDILYSLEINHFLHRYRDKNIKYKAYFAEFGQLECVNSP